MVTTNDVRKFIESEGYIDLLSEAASILQLSINNQIPPSQMFNIEANGVNKSNVSLKELEELCVSDKRDVIRYINNKLLDVKGEVDDYNDIEDKDCLVEKLPFYKTFLLGYLIEYALLKSHSDNLETYLQSLRIPKYKKYASELRDIYSRM